MLCAAARGAAWAAWVCRRSKARSGRVPRVQGDASGWGWLVSGRGAGAARAHRPHPPILARAFLFGMPGATTSASPEPGYPQNAGDEPSNSPIQKFSARRPLTAEKTGAVHARQQPHTRLPQPGCSACCHALPFCLAYARALFSPSVMYWRCQGHTQFLCSHR